MREKERQEDLLSASLLRNWLRWPKLSLFKVGTWNLFQVSRVAVLDCLPRPLAENWMGSKPAGPGTSTTDPDCNFKIK